MAEENAAESELVEEPAALIKEPILEDPDLEELEALERELAALEDEDDEETIEAPAPKPKRVRKAPKLVRAEPDLVRAEPKRRGRPPGSRNREPAPAPPSDPMEQLVVNMRQRRQAQQERQQEFYRGFLPS